MTKADLIALATTYSTVITMDEAARGQHLSSMAEFLDSQPALAGTDVVDVPMRSYCWRATKRLNIVFRSCESRDDVTKVPDQAQDAGLQ